MWELDALRTVALPIVFDFRIVDPLSRLSNSRCATEPSPEQRTAYLYDEDALIPTLPFLPAQAGDFIFHRVSSATEADYRSSFIGIFDLTEEASEFLKLGLGGLISEPEVKVVARSSAFRVALDIFATAVEERFSVSGGLEMLGISTKPPGLPTSTFNNKSGFRPGLHVDSWDSSGSGTNSRKVRGLGRAQARNRIAINLGAEPRQFIFLDAALSRLATCIGVDPTDDRRVEKLGREALNWLLPPRLIQISLQPGEAYVAPTEDLLHDATTLGKDQIDISLSFLGSISVPNEPLSILQHPGIAVPN